MTTKEITAATDSDSVTDDVIWKYLGELSPKQIADKLGVDPISVMSRARELLTEVDVLTIDQKRMKLMVDISRIARKAEEAFDSAADERNKSGLLNSAVNAQKAVLDQLERLEKRDRGELVRLNEMRVRELVRLIETAVAGTFEFVAEVYPDVDSEVLMKEFRERLTEAAGDR